MWKAQTASLAIAALLLKIDNVIIPLIAAVVLWYGFFGESDVTKQQTQEAPQSQEEGIGSDVPPSGPLSSEEGEDEGRGSHSRTAIGT